MTKLTEIKSEWERTVTQDDLLNGWKIDGVAPKFYRVGKLVVFTLTTLGLDGSAATDRIFMNAPMGYRPNFGGNYGKIGSLRNLQNQEVALIKSHLGGFLRLLTETTQESVDGVATWITGDSPPLFLSGFLGRCARLVGWSK